VPLVLYFLVAQDRVLEGLVKVLGAGRGRCRGVDLWVWECVVGEGGPIGVWYWVICIEETSPKVLAGMGSQYSAVRAKTLT
jgi:hypothetical protein